MIRIKSTALIKTQDLCPVFGTESVFGLKTNWLKEKLDLLLQKDLANSSLDLILILFFGSNSDVSCSSWPLVMPSGRFLPVHYPPWWHRKMVLGSCPNWRVYHFQSPFLTGASVELESWFKSLQFFYFYPKLFFSGNIMSMKVYSKFPFVYRQMCMLVTILMFFFLYYFICSQICYLFFLFLMILFQI